MRNYTPQVRPESTFALKRLSWALGIPMTETLDMIVSAYVSKLKNKKYACSSCKDKRCKECMLKYKKLRVEENLGELLKTEAERLAAESASL